MALVSSRSSPPPVSSRGLGWADTTRYRVRAFLSRLDGWLLGTHPRGTEVLVTVRRVMPETADRAASGPSFGERPRRR